MRRRFCAKTVSKWSTRHAVFAVQKSWAVKRNGSCCRRRRVPWKLNGRPNGNRCDLAVATRNRKILRPRRMRMCICPSPCRIPASQRTATEWAIWMGRTRSTSIWTLARNITELPAKRRRRMRKRWLRWSLLRRGEHRVKRLRKR